MKLFHKQKEKGFTLVESLVAISIFSLAILSMMVVLGRGISDTGYIKKKMIATYLAQEGIEYVRNIKDDYVLYASTEPSVGWSMFVSKLTAAGTRCDLEDGCYFDDQALSFSDQNMPMAGVSLLGCNNTTCSAHPLLYDPLTSKYGYAAGITSGFTRKIVLNYIDNDNASFTSTVYWSQAGISRNISFTENVTNWTE